VNRISIFTLDHALELRFVHPASRGVVYFCGTEIIRKERTRYKAKNSLDSKKRKENDHKNKQEVEEPIFYTGSNVNREGFSKERVACCCKEKNKSIDNQVSYKKEYEENNKNSCHLRKGEC